MIIKMAFRNLLRHKIRTGLTMFTIFFGVFITIFGIGLNEGVARDVIFKFINTQTGHILIFPKEYYENREEEEIVKYNINKYENLYEILKNTKNIEFSSRIAFDGTILKDLQEIPVIFNGINPENEDKVFDLKSHIVKGNLFSKYKDQIIISSENAKLLGLNIGDFITITLRDSKRGMNAVDMEITGIYITGNPKIDNNILFMDYEVAERITLLNSPNIINIKLDNPSSLELVFNSLISKINNNEVKVITWEEELKDFIEIMKMKENNSNIVVYIILLMAGFGIANTIIMCVYERKKEIGILKACGFTSRKVAILFIIEAMLLGIIAGGLGCIAGGGSVYYLSYIGIPVPEGQDMITDDFPIEDRMYSYFNFFKTLKYFFLSVFVCIFSALYPAYMAARLDPVYILKN